MINVKQYDYKREFSLFGSEYEAKAVEVLRSGWYTLGEELCNFESEWASYLGAKHCVGLASGLDALWITIRLLGIKKGDEVIVPIHTYIASVMGISINGATPVFVEPDEYYGIDTAKIEEKITPNTKAILVVHLYGMPCQMDKIIEICQKYRLHLVEDCAQSHGAAFQGKMTGTFGTGCFSFFPTKTLGAFGDAGGVVTNDDVLVNKFRVFRNYGSSQRYHFDVVGANSRLDEMQAGLLRVKLKHLGELIQDREKIVYRYMNELNNPNLILPRVRPGTSPTWHQIVVRCEDRKRLMDYMKGYGVDTYVHYPIPPHLSGAYQYLGYRKGDFPIAEIYADTVLSLPLYAGMTDEEQSYVIQKLNMF